MSRKLNSKSVPVIVAVIGLIGVIITALVTYLVSKPDDNAENPQLDYYKIRVVEKVSDAFIGNAKVTIELSGNIIPLDAVTDSNGLAIITIPEEYMGKPGKLIVESQEHQTFYKFVNLSRDSLPDVVQLEKK
ncbi:MAG: hypothetical protein L6461_03250 [Anaerolineae bacterium]|nr:hypothetical protein [Anaerolineae bacterium]